jgi:uncharacterized membrane protein YgdD (TMEM256/DUF423 family)
MSQSHLVEHGESIMFMQIISRTPYSYQQVHAFLLLQLKYIRRHKPIYHIMCISIFIQKMGFYYFSAVLYIALSKPRVL